IWVGGRTPPAGAIRDLLSHIISRTAESKRQAAASSASASS
ncbi:MAG TPA: hypothetical protein VFQ42_08885, partial [Mycobacterium sp.]|nr:hypothetical protein [Mycobacterium sp.]